MRCPFYKQTTARGYATGTAKLSKRGHWRASPAVRGSLWLAAAVSIATLALVAAACGGGTESPAAGKSCGTTPSSRAIHTPAARVPHFGHVVVVVFENREYGEVIGSSDAPTFNRLARTYAEGLPAPASPARTPAATRRSTTRSSTSAMSSRTAGGWLASFPSHSSIATSLRPRSRTSRSSSQTFATTSTTAPSRKATAGSGRSCRR